METPEEKRARRLAKKEAKERRRKEKMGWDKDYLVYYLSCFVVKKLELRSTLEQYKCTSQVPNYIYEKLLCCFRGTQIQIILLGMKVF